jgi:transcriptional regulator with XRE-family HTH domain
MKIKFNQIEFSNAVKEKMFNEMLTEKRRIGVREFAKRIGISAPTLSRIENGRTPDINTYLKLCQWLKANPATFTQIKK